MGRKPNPIASEFFVRGRKLDDASNRYEQTCKFCNERFPKGRIDALITHIVKRCAAVPPIDRQRAIQQYTSMPHAVHVPLESQDLQAQFTSLPLQHDPGLSALETLAEVSRHHLDYQSQGFAAGGLEEHMQDVEAGDPPARKKRRMQSKAKPDAFTLSRPEGGPFASSNVQQHFQGVTDVEAQKLAAALYEAQVAQEVDPTTEFLVQDDPAEVVVEAANDTAITQSNASAALQLAASAASELMTPAATAGHDEQVDGEAATPSLPTRFHADAQAPVIDPQLQRDNETDVAIAIARAAGFRTIASKPALPEAFVATPKQKARGKFTEIRRKEVQNVRKLGACLRCRMLKKPCSDDTPCKQCLKIDSARLWKHPCIRARLQDEISLWSCGLFTVRAFQSVSRIKSLLSFESAPGRVEVAALGDPTITITFAGLRASRTVSENYDPTLLKNEGVTKLQKVHCLATEAEDVLAKVEHFTRRLSADYFLHETSPVMKATLESANAIALYYSALVVKSVSELWLCTKILCGDLELQVMLNNVEAAQDLPFETDAEGTRAPHRSIVTPGTNPKTHELIRAQVLGATEKRATVLAKTVLNELERQLIQRQQSNKFEIFIVAVILSACVERMCRHFGTLETRHGDGLIPSNRELPQGHATGRYNDSTDPALQDLEQQLRLAAGPTQSAPSLVSVPTTWPLAEPPSYYRQQGDRFTDILHMLMRMRNITPLNIVNEGGILTVTNNGQRSEMREWFEAVELSEADLNGSSEVGEGLGYLRKLLTQYR